MEIGNKLALNMRSENKTNLANYLVTGLVLIIGLWASFALYKKNTDKNFKLLNEEFTSVASSYSDFIEAKFTTRKEEIEAINRFYQSSNDVSKTEFASFVTDLFRQEAGYKALLWAPYIDLVNKEQFEKTASEIHGFDYKIKKFKHHEMAKTGNHKPMDKVSSQKKDDVAGHNKTEKDFIAPVLYAEPYLTNKNALGFDITSEAVRKSALLKAISKKQTIASEKITLVHNENDPSGLMIIRPVYLEGDPLTVEHPTGFIIGRMSAKKVILSALKDKKLEGLSISMVDFDPWHREQGQEVYAVNNKSKPNDRGVTFKRKLDVFEHNWNVTITPTDGYFRSRLSVDSEILLILGAILTITMAFYIFTILNQRKRFSDKNIDLNRTLVELGNTQKQLIEAEKMAALGGLVSGVAHEINTPLGVSISANSHLRTESSRVIDLFKNNNLKKSNLESFLDSVDQTTGILEINLKRSAELVRNFKQVAVDQSSEEIRKFDLSEYVTEILSSLKPEWKHTKVHLECDFPEKIEITTYPGAIAQIITNFVTNAVKHAFDDGKIDGTISIKLSKEEEKVRIVFSDDGNGMDQDILDKIFDPFFTTKRGHGGTGLGMHIVYNLVTQKLNGKIETQSSIGQGTQFSIELPEAI